jgi:putative copper resistance protein D
MITAVLVLARTLHIGSALLLVSLLFFRQFILSPDAAANLESDLNAVFSKQTVKWLIGAFLVQIISGGVWFWIVSADMSGNSLLDVLDFSLLKTIFGQTQFGQLWLWRMVIAFVLGTGLLGVWRSMSPSSGRKSIWTWMALAFCGLLLISLAWAGHAASGTNNRALHISIDILHLVIAAVWPVELVPLTIFLCTLPKMSQSSKLGYVILILNRFSRTSLVAVTLLFLTGLTNACFLVPSLSALFTSSYGQLLLGKIGLFLAMVGLGARNRLHYLPKLTVSSSTSAAFVRLRGMVLIESMLSLIVLLIVGAMGVTAPPQLPH